MKRALAIWLALAVLGCGGMGQPGPGEFAVSVADLMADENDGVECRLGRTNGGTITFLDWKYTFGDPVIRPFPEGMQKPEKRPRQMMVVPVTLENKQPKKRSYDRTFKIHRTDGEVFDSHSILPDWVAEAMGKPNITTDHAPFTPGETRDGFVMFTVKTPESAEGAVIRVYAKEKIPGTRRTRMKDHICVEIGEPTLQPVMVKP